MDVIYRMIIFGPQTMHFTRNNVRRCLNSGREVDPVVAVGGGAFILARLRQCCYIMSGNAEGAVRGRSQHGLSGPSQLHSSGQR